VIRLLVLTHRYLGMALGVVISLWCLSGFVMMYEPYPELHDRERLAGMEPLRFEACCRLPADFGDGFGDGETGELDGFRLEMMGETPVLRLLAGESQHVFDLRGGVILDRLRPADARSVAATVARARGWQGAPRWIGTVERDQWTVYPGYDPHRPLFHFAMDDPAGTELYLSSTTGELVQVTTFRQRFWNRMGAVVHWIYPTVLRQHTDIWRKFVIGLTVLSLFLASIGIYIGIRQFRSRRDGRRSPHRGWGLWHHYTGLVFGLLTLTWLFSGLFSFNPLGVLAGRSFHAEEQRLRGGTMRFEDAREFVRSIPTHGIAESTVRLDVAMTLGQLHAVASDREGRRIRHAVPLRPEPLSESFFARAASILRPDAAAMEAGWLSEGDAYYYSYHEQRRFPVFRIRYEDGERFYLDSVTGAVAHAVDRKQQGLRWVFEGLHRGDVSALARSRPFRDLMMWPLLLGVTACALTGTWMG